MEIEKAIELFENCDTVVFVVMGCGEESHKTIEFKTMVEAAKNGISKKVICETVDECGIEYEFIHYRCPNCKNIIHQQYKKSKVIVPYRQNYCVDCGQKLDWGDEQ